MKVKHYNEMMAYLTRPGFNGGGSVSNRNVLPKRKPAEEVKKRKKINYEKLKQYLGEESRELIERELGFEKGGSVRENISPMKSGSGNTIGYRVRSRKEGIEKFFSTSKYGSLEKALEAAKEFRKENLGMTLTNEDYFKLRNANKNLSAKEFADFLNTSPEGYKPKKGDKFTKFGIKQRDQKVDFKTTRKVEKKIVDQNIKDKIYKEYLQAVGEGKREGSIIGLGRKYFPGETKDSQQKAIQRILREKGVDITPFKKTGPGTGTTSTKKTRTETLIKGKKFAGSEAGQLSDEILLDIKAMNDKVKNMSLEDIAANKKYIKSMRLNASMDNLSKGKLVFDKYKDLTDLEVAQKIKDRAAANKFFDVEHISSVKGKARNIYYPNNIQMTTGNIGPFMENFKRLPIEQPDNVAISQIDNFLSEYNLTVRDTKNNIRLGNKKVIEVTDGVSNIVVDNFNAVNTPFEKQTVVKPTPSKSVTKQSIVKTAKPVTIGSNFANVSPELFDLRKLPDDVKDVSNVIRDLIKTPGGKRIARNLLKAGRFTGYGLASELAFAAPFALDDYASGLEGDRILSNATLGLFGTTEDEEIRKATGELGYATQTIDELQKLIPEIADKYQTYNDQNDPRGEKREQFRNLLISTKKRYDKAYDLFVTDKGNFDTQLYNKGVTNYAAGLNQIEKFRAAKEKERGIKGQKTGFELDLDLSFAGGGIAKQAGDESGKPPESGPTPDGPEGLFSALKYVKKS